MNRKAEILRKLGEPMAAGMFEDENASIVERFGRGLRRYFEYAVPPPEIGLLYPTLEQNIWRLGGESVRFDYSYSIQVDANGLRSRGNETLGDPFEKVLLERAIGELNFFRTQLIAPRYALGGSGFTHSILNYRRILKEGLGNYIARVGAMSDSALKSALCDTLAGLTGFLDRAPGNIREDVMAPARDFRSAMRCFNFFYALDEYDSAGRFDDYMGEYYHGEAEAADYLAELFRSTDLHNGWHFTYSGKFSEFTELCIRSQKLRRPNSGALITPGTPANIWNAILDNWAAGIPSPSLYNAEVYTNSMPVLTDVRAEDRPHFAFGGCTEFMVGGCSNVGSIDGGIHLLEILQQGSPETLKDDIRRHLEAVAADLRGHWEFAGRYRPQLIRTLFIDDCIEREKEYNAGGARYYGSVINVVGLTDTANSLAAMRGLKEKFGNDRSQVDKIACDLAEYTFREINRHSIRYGGWAIPGVILFATYALYGSYIDATPDGRDAGAPVADSAGAAAGTDLQGPTALLNSIAGLPSHLGLGTLITNLRLERGLAAGQRENLLALLKSFFEMGGMQLQPTLVDRETMRKAYENPAEYPDLIVRIGGYSEYYNRLSRELQLEVLKRTEHRV